MLNGLAMLAGLGGEGDWYAMARRYTQLYRDFFPDGVFFSIPELKQRSMWEAIFQKYVLATGTTSEADAEGVADTLKEVLGSATALA